MLDVQKSYDDQKLKSGEKVKVVIELTNIGQI